MFFIKSVIISLQYYELQADKRLINKEIYF